MPTLDGMIEELDENLVTSETVLFQYRVTGSQSPFSRTESKLQLSLQKDSRVTFWVRISVWMQLNSKNALSQEPTRLSYGVCAFSTLPFSREESSDPSYWTSPLNSVTQTCPFLKPSWRCSWIITMPLHRKPWDSWLPKPIMVVKLQIQTMGSPLISSLRFSTSKTCSS